MYIILLVYTIKVDSVTSITIPLCLDNKDLDYIMVVYLSLKKKDTCVVYNIILISL